METDSHVLRVYETDGCQPPAPVFSSFSSLLCDHPPPSRFNSLHCLPAGSAHEETYLLGFPVFLRAALESSCLNTTAVALLIMCTRQAAGCWRTWRSTLHTHHAPTHSPPFPLSRTTYSFNSPSGDIPRLQLL